MKPQTRKAKERYKTVSENIKKNPLIPSAYRGRTKNPTPWPSHSSQWVTPGAVVDTVVLPSWSRVPEGPEESGRIIIYPRKGIENIKYMHNNFIIAMIETFSVQKCSNCITSLPSPAIITSTFLNCRLINDSWIRPLRFFVIVTINSCLYLYMCHAFS